MYIHEILGVNDSIVEPGKLIVPEVQNRTITTVNELGQHIGSILRLNWNLTGQRSWEATERALGRADSSASELEQETSTQVTLLLENTGLHVYGSIVADSEKTWRQRKDWTGRDELGQSFFYPVGNVIYSVGDENEGLYASVEYTIQRGAGDPDHRRPPLLYGTLPNDYPTDKEKPFNKTRVQAVMKFIQENLK